MKNNTHTHKKSPNEKIMRQATLVTYVALAIAAADILALFILSRI
jgi:hypothetical protein